MFAPPKLFHFVFANREDDYYTSSLMKLTPEGLIWRDLIDRQYRSVIIKEKKIISDDYTLLLTGIPSQKFCAEQKKKKKSIFGFRSRDSEESDTPLRDSRKEKLEIHKDSIMDTIDKVIQMMNGTEGKIALVIPIRLLQKYCESNDERKNKIKKLSKKNNENIIVIVSGVFAEENDPFFISPEWMRERKEKIMDSVFTEKDFYPELYKALSPDNEKPRMILTYDIMQSVLGERMNVLNQVTVPAVSHILKYHAIRNGLDYHDVSTDMAAVIIFLWFKNMCFYDTYEYTGLMSENISRSFRIIAEDVCKIGFEEKMKEIIGKENISDPQQLLEKWQDTENGLYFPQNKTSVSQRSVVQIMRKYKKLLPNDTAADRDRQKDIADLIFFFQKPCYISREITGIPAFLNFENTTSLYSASRHTAEGIVQYLGDKKEWNEWDHETARLLYILFYFCRTEAEEECCIDYQCRTGQMRYGKLLEAMDCFRRYSERNSGQLGELERLKRCINEAVCQDDVSVWEKLIFPIP